MRYLLCLTYSLTLNIESLKLIFTLSGAFHWDIFQLDIKASYLNAPLSKYIYTIIPKSNINFGRGYWKFNKSLNDIKHSGRQ